MAQLLSSADLVVSRAGAGTLAELVRCETPAILIPYPHAADHHQHRNAEFFERQGGGLVLDQAMINGLAGEVMDAIFNEWLLRKFRANLRRMDLANSLETMLLDLEEIADSDGNRSGPPGGRVNAMKPAKTQSSPFPGGRRVHCLGVGGMGVAPLAIYLSESGCTVSGEDDALPDEVGALLERARVAVGPLPAQVDRVVYSSAIPASHPAYAAAAAREHSACPPGLNARGGCPRQEARRCLWCARQDDDERDARDRPPACKFSRRLPRRRAVQRRPSSCCLGSIYPSIHLSIDLSIYPMYLSIFSALTS